MSRVLLSLAMALSLARTGLGGAKPAFDPDLPPTALRFGWLRHEHQKPGEKSPRVRSRQDNPFRNNFDSLRLAIQDLTQTFGKDYPNGAKYLARLEKIEKAVKESDAPLQPLADAFQALLRELQASKTQLDRMKRFDMPDFVPSPHYLREMKRFGILPANHDDAEHVDCYELDQKYWKSFWLDATMETADSTR